MASDQNRLAFAQLVNVLRERYEVPEKKRSGNVVVLMGAGASLESGYHLWSDSTLKNLLMEAVRPVFGEGSFDAEARHRLAPHWRTLGSELRTDQLCEVACSLALGRDRLIDFLQKTYSPGKNNVQPQLAYELISHLTKHRFIDHLISLNFDEVLDAALDDELGHGGYRLVLPGASMPDRVPPIPHLFKLHGTISDTDSLRFALEDTGTLSDRIIAYLERVVFSPGTRARSVTIVSLGYSWEDPDMCSWIARHFDRVKEVICVALDTAPARRLAAALRPKRRGLPIYSLATQTAVPPGESAATVDEVLWAVWRETKSQARHHQRVPTAARHLLLAHLFGSRNPRKRTWPAVFDQHTHARRFEAEVFLTAGKTDGLVILSSLARDTRVIRHWSAIPRPARPALASLPFLKPSTFHDVTEVYFSAGLPSDYVYYFKRARGTVLPLSGAVIPDLRTQTISVPYLVNGQIVRRQERYYAFLKYYLEKVFNGPSVEIDPELDDRASLLFRDPVRLPTYKALADQTKELVSRPWNVLLAIAESGKWFSDHEADLQFSPERPILLIEASPYALRDWTAQPDVDLSKEGVLTIGIPWWVHNRHMTLAICTERDEEEGIYFRRRERTPRISPVALRGEDVPELLKIFLSYSARYYETYTPPHTHSRTAVYEANARCFFEILSALPLERYMDGEAAEWRKRLAQAWEAYRRRSRQATKIGRPRKVSSCVPKKLRVWRLAPASAPANTGQAAP